MRNKWLHMYSALIFIQWPTLFRLVWVRTSIEMITRVHWTNLRRLYYQDTCVWKVQSPVNQYSCHNYTRMTNEHSKHLWERVIENIRQRIKKNSKSVNTPKGSHISIIKKQKECGTHANLPGTEWPCKWKMWEGAHQVTSDYPGFLSLTAVIWENLHMTNSSSLTRQKWNLFSPSGEARCNEASAHLHL